MDIFMQKQGKAVIKSKPIKKARKLREVLQGRPRKKKSLTTKKPKKISPERQEYLNHIALLDEIYDYLTEHSEYTIIWTHHYLWLIAKMVSLNVSKVINSNGFQPFQVANEEQHCLLGIVEVGNSPKDTEGLPCRLKKMGCPVIHIQDKREIEEKLYKFGKQHESC